MVRLRIEPSTNLGAVLPFQRETRGGGGELRSRMSLAASRSFPFLNLIRNLSDFSLMRINPTGSKRQNAAF